MTIKFLLKIACLCSLLVSPLWADKAESSMAQTTIQKNTSPNNLTCAPQLQKHLKAIQSLEEGKRLVDAVLAEGPLKIAVADNHVTKQFSACWDCDSRTILISLSLHPTDGQIIASLIFELHNASKTSHLDHLDQLAQNKHLDRANYIRAVELVEYINSINGSRLARIGIQQGKFPKDVSLHVYKNFEEYFYFQRQSGHSKIIEQNYNMMMRS